MSKNNISFVPYGTELLNWAIEKDRRYFTADKMSNGMQSYVNALHDLGFFFKKVRMGELRANSQTVSAWARMWGWDYRKALRFITIVLRDLFDLNDALKKAKALKERLEVAYRRQKEKATNYVRKLRGTVVSANNIIDDESDDERLFLDAMAALAKTNPIYYRATIKEKLRCGDAGTVANFQKWLGKHYKREISAAEVAQAVATRIINGHRIIAYSIMHDGKYMVEFDDGFRTPMTAEAIVGDTYNE